MEKVSIRDLHRAIGERPEPYAVHAQLEALLQKTSRAGKPYYEFRFTDAEEGLTLRAWNDTPMFEQAATLKKKGFFEISGDWFFNADFNSVEAKTWELRPLDEEEVAALLAGSESLGQRQAEDFQYIQEAVSGLEDPRLRGLGERFLETFGERFRRTGAARDYHHARRGGLVEHVAQMMRSASAIASAYPDLNRDLLVCGVLFHDVGKLWENVYSPKGFTMPYLETGELIGHIPMGMELVNKLWRDLLDEPEAADWMTLDPPNEQVRLHLLHLIGAHHGEMQFGSPVVPKTPEAIALHYIDNLDAKLEMFARGYEVAAELGKNVYERVRPLPGRLVTPLPKFVPGAEGEARDEGEAEEE